MRSPHGSRSRYANAGCRCAPCVAANSEYLRARRGTKGDPKQARYYEPLGGMLAVTCWCERIVVMVDVDAIGAATHSCGRPGCKEPTDAAA